MQALLRNAPQIVHLVVKALAWRGRHVGHPSHRWHHERVSGLESVRDGVALWPAGRHTLAEEEGETDVDIDRSGDRETWR